MRWTPEEEQALRDLYAKAGEDGVLGLDAFAASVGRDKTNVCRKARKMGLPISTTRKKVEARKDRRKFATAEELKAEQSRLAKVRIAENGHPKGFKGRAHTAETRAAIGAKSKAVWDAMTEEERQAHTDKALRANLGAPKVGRGSWKAAWHEIGGQRNFYRSQWEANYARYLQWLKDAGHILDWKHEPETFWFEKIKRGVRSYKPDFRVWENNGTSALHEVKGWMDSRSRTCLARMKKYHPQETVIVIDERQYRAIRAKVAGLIPGWEDTPRAAKRGAVIVEIGA